MPCDYSMYPANWHSEIRPAVLERAGNCCEECGIPNHTEGWRFPSGKFYTADELAGSYMPPEDEDAMEAILARKPNPYKIILTVAHLDRTGPPGEGDGPLDCPIDRLRALCQRCHFRLDHERHRAKVKATREARKASRPDLFNQLP